MFADNAFQFSSLEGLDDLMFTQFEFCHQAFDQVFQHDHLAFFGRDNGIGQIRMQGDGNVGRQGPRRRGPDDELFIPFQYTFAVLDIKADKNRRVLAVKVDDLGIGDRCLLVWRPVDRL